jgi:16S rRNA (guanine527-N7)-methyltransferase
MLLSISDIQDKLQQNFDVSRETISKLEEYVILLEKWNKKINLVKYELSIDLWERHILDSAQLIKYIDTNKVVMDLGSGGGLPGIVLSILGIKEITLVEADSRKSVFLHQAARLSNQKVEVKNLRIENLEPVNVDIITSRALCSIAKFCSLIASFKNNATILLLKGRTVFEEIKEAETIWSFDYLLHKSVTSKDSFIVEIHNLKRKNNE